MRCRPVLAGHQGEPEVVVAILEQAGRSRSRSSARPGYHRRSRVVNPHVRRPPTSAAPAERLLRPRRLGLAARRWALPSGVAGTPRRRHLLAGRDLPEPGARPPAGLRLRAAWPGSSSRAPATGRCRGWWPALFKLSRAARGWTSPGRYLGADAERSSRCWGPAPRWATLPAGAGGRGLARWRRRRGGRAASRSRAVPLYFAPRAMSETASALPVVLGPGAGARRPGRPARARRWPGASLLGLAVLLRLQSGVFCVGLARRCWRRGAVAARAREALARARRVGAPLRTARPAHLGRLVPLGASCTWTSTWCRARPPRWGTAPFSYYPRVLCTVHAGARRWCWRCWRCSRRGARPAPVRAGRRLLPARTRCSPHKELRFLLPLLPAVRRARRRGAGRGAAPHCAPLPAPARPAAGGGGGGAASPACASRGAHLRAARASTRTRPERERLGRLRPGRTGCSRGGRRGRTCAA